MFYAIGLSYSQPTGKLERGLRVEASGSETSVNRLIVIDCKSRIEFLIDTGANVSVVPKGSRKSPAPNEPKLYANGTIINTYSKRLLVLDLSLHREFSWTFMVADVQRLIIGADFLSYYDLLVDMATTPN